MAGDDLIKSALEGNPVYKQNKWKCVQTRKFTEEELKKISKAEVTQGNFGISVCLTLVDGNRTFITVDGKPGTGYGSISYGEDIKPEELVIKLLKNTFKENYPELYKEEPETCLRVVKELPKPTETQASDFNNPLGI